MLPELPGGSPKGVTPGVHRTVPGRKEYELTHFPIFLHVTAEWLLGPGMA